MSLLSWLLVDISSNYKVSCVLLQPHQRAKPNPINDMILSRSTVMDPCWILIKNKSKWNLDHRFGYMLTWRDHPLMQCNSHGGQRDSNYLRETEWETRISISIPWFRWENMVRESNRDIRGQCDPDINILVYLLFLVPPIAMPVHIHPPPAKDLLGKRSRT